MSRCLTPAVFRDSPSSHRRIQHGHSETYLPSTGIAHHELPRSPQVAHSRTCLHVSSRSCRILTSLPLPCIGRQADEAVRHCEPLDVVPGGQDAGSRCQVYVLLFSPAPSHASCVDVTRLPSGGFPQRPPQPIRGTDREAVPPLENPLYFARSRRIQPALMRQCLPACYTVCTYTVGCMPHKCACILCYLRE